MAGPQARPTKSGLQELHSNTLPRSLIGSSANVQAGLELKIAIGKPLVKISTYWEVVGT